MASSLRASAAGLACVDQARRRKGWTKTWTAAWWESAYTSQATLRRFWRGLAIQREPFIAICEVVGVNWEIIALGTGTEFDASLSESSSASTEMSEVARSEGDRLISPDATLPELPEGPVNLASPFYIERPPTEVRCYQTILKPGALIRIKAPRQMGKTSLVDRILHHAAAQNYRTVRLNLLQADPATLSDLNQFLRWFCACISQKLRLENALETYWECDRGSIVNCTTYLQEHVLEYIDGALVIALDEVDRLFQHGNIAQSFFPMLRSWYEEAKTMEVWEKLRLIVVHSTENYGELDINQSPFNVGLPIELMDFTAEQVNDLAQRHRLTLNPDQQTQLMNLLGGHPYLIRLALYHLACQDVTLDQLLQDAATPVGIYEDHLRRHWKNLSDSPSLAEAFLTVATATQPLRIGLIQTYQLYSMGLIHKQGDVVIPRCLLYRQYFQDQLKFLAISSSLA
ncbi:MAG: AAA-like domain-containing protein [Thermosynechococcaceae cyanobacterium]